MADELVGRGHDLAAIERLLDRAHAGLGALVFDGEAGIGKTRRDRPHCPGVALAVPDDARRAGHAAHGEDTATERQAP